MKEQKSRFTRRELYDLVWQEPVDRLAQRFQISGRGLGKLCERHAIPVPPRGYWARKAAGQRLIRPPLIELQFGREPPQFDIAISPRRETTGAAPENATADPFGDLWNRLVRENHLVSVPARLAKPHPMVAALLEEEKREHERYGRAIGAGRYTSPLARRQLRILSGLFKQLERAGFRLEADRQHPSAFVARYQREEVRFDLKQRIKQYRRQLTLEEKANSWSPTQRWTQVREPTDELVLKITSYGPEHVPSQWQDDQVRLEQKLHLVIAGFVVCAAYSAEMRARREAEDRRRHDLHEQAQRREAIKKAELARKQALRDQASAWQEANQLRAFVVAVQEKVAEGLAIMPLEELGSWTAWANACADEIDPTAVAGRVP